MKNYAVKLSDGTWWSEQDGSTILFGSVEGAENNIDSWRETSHTEAKTLLGAKPVRVLIIEMPEEERGGYE